MKTKITTHILDTHLGKPASNISVSLYAPGSDTPIGQAQTNLDGRIDNWGHELEIIEGDWRIEFMTDKWFTEQNKETFYNDISIFFKVTDINQHYHIPLLLNAFGYTTYRGS